MRVLAQMRAFVGAGDATLTPRAYVTFEQWRQHCYHVFRAAGLGRKTDTFFHDLRRTFACERMDYLTNVRGRCRDDAEALVARELGHSRIAILEWYVAESGDATEAA